MNAEGKILAFEKFLAFEKSKIINGEYSCFDPMSATEKQSIKHRNRQFL